MNSQTRPGDDREGGADDGGAHESAHLDRAHRAQPGPVEVQARIAIRVNAAVEHTSANERGTVKTRDRRATRHSDPRTPPGRATAALTSVVTKHCRN